MKFNWGHGIVVAFVLFISFILYSVFLALQTDIDLVSDTYYKDELVYQARIDEKSNLINSGVEVKMEQTGNQLLIQFPDEFAQAEGEIHFYHPSREIFDKHYEIALNQQHAQLINKDDLVKGRFKVKINWKSGNTPYFQEREVFLQ